MKAILFIGHGSREKEGNEQVRQIVKRIRERTPAYLIEVCFLELAHPDMETGLARCVEQGATSIAVVPIMLFAASHSKLHIPRAIDEARLRYPQVSFSYGRPIGIHEEMLLVCQQRLEETGFFQEHEAEPQTVILLGRGSSDGDANSDLYKLARLLSEKLHCPVEPAFIGVTQPSLEERVATCYQLGARNMIVLPYFLFTGVLMNRLFMRLEKLSEHYPDANLSTASYLGFHSRLENVLIERMEEAAGSKAQMNCDTCQFRIQASHDHHHDHHHHDHHDHHHDHHHHHSHEHHDQDHHHHHDHLVQR